ncbi:unnamed protein product [Anisakis simplex]|uniref:BZIP domain-containing protein n=1 Tax=Anisakis simplex TaxID=6269 RepID=A0A0M3JR35_ANISI|nr:unnamed protein product [Anisakis simplex]
MFIGDDSPKQIFEEIVRECEEIERFSCLSSMSSACISSSSSFTDDSSEQSRISLRSEDESNVKKRKALNRAAAIRYRKRKREEHELTKREMLELEIHNTKLKNRVTELQNEITYLRNFMNEIRSRTL